MPSLLNLLLLFVGSTFVEYNCDQPNKTMASATEKAARKEAKYFGLKLEVGVKLKHFEVEVCSPDGFRLEDETHSKVNSAWDETTNEQIWKSALEDIRYYGPRLEKCPDDCPCKED
jgi:hypothetical protein